MTARKAPGMVVARCGMEARGPGAAGRGIQCQRRGEGEDAMREQPNGDVNPDDVFQTTHEIHGGVACFTGTRVGVSQSYSATSGTATRLTTS